MKIIHEQNKCIGCGVCAAIDPKHFEMNKDNKAQLKKGKKKGDNFELEIKETTSELDGAKNSCPVMCIHIKD